jgi:hypothetical protein
MWPKTVRHTLKGCNELAVKYTNCQHDVTREYNQEMKYSVDWKTPIKTEEVREQELTQELAA